MTGTVKGPLEGLNEILEQKGIEMGARAGLRPDQSSSPQQADYIVNFGLIRGE